MKNKKGFTTVELVVSFALVMTIATLLFQVVLSLKNLYVNSNVKTQLLNKQALVTNQINEQLLNKKMQSFTSCGNNCIEITYQDNSKNTLVVNTSQRYIEFNDERTYLLDNSNFGSIIMDKYQVPVNDDTIHNDVMLLINIPIYYNNGKEDYGIHITYQYNSTGVYIEPSQDVYTPTYLADTLIKQYNETNTVGLLKDDTGYYYKGTNTEVANNYVWFAGHLWRVLSIDANNNLTMITQQPLTSIEPANYAWSTQAAYEASYINHWLNSETDGVFYKSLTNEDKAKILNSTFNVGIYNNVSEITTTQKVGLLDETQYTKAGGQNSFLDIKDYWWLSNRYSTSNVRYVGNNGNFNNSLMNFAIGVRPVIKISNLTFTRGKGTLDDPYRDSSTTTNTANIKVGEYVSIPTTGTDCGTDKRCLFRVVSKDSDSIKVTLNGLLPNVISTTTTYTSGSEIDNMITTFAGTINENYRYSETDKTFGIGTYGLVVNYTTVQDTRYTGYVGLPVVGEMFTGNDLDMTTGSTAKTFVNVNTIENPTVSGYFWTMNTYSTTGSDGVCYVPNSGNLLNNGGSRAYGVRPVLFLNNNLTFTGGEGTAESPFTLD